MNIESVRTILAKTQTFRGRPIRITSIHTRHVEQKCFRVELYDTPTTYKVRLATPANRQSVITEHEAFRILQQQGFAWAPQIYEFQADDPIYLIVSYKDGSSLDKSLFWVSHADLIVEDLGRLLADIHKIKGDYFGHIGGKRYSSWTEFFNIRLSYHIWSLVRAGIISDSDLQRVRALYEETIESLSEVCPTFLHADIKPGNILFDSARAKTILVDFELARYGDVDFEWTKLYRLALRWPKYRNFIVEPILSRMAPAESRNSIAQAKLLLYSFYHACSFMEYDLNTGLPIPTYRMNDLSELLEAVRLHTAR